MTSISANHENWARDVFSVMSKRDIEVACTVPDGGLTELLKLCEHEPSIRLVTLSTEEEGVALSCGSWLGGKRAVLLLQSSGVGNCINMLSLPISCRIPCFMLVTMRGEWGEFNPWQVPMGQSTSRILEEIGVIVYRPSQSREIGETFECAANFAFNTGNSVAVLVSQRIIGAKKF